MTKELVGNILLKRFMGVWGQLIEQMLDKETECATARIVIAEDVEVYLVAARGNSKLADLKDNEIQVIKIEKLEGDKDGTGSIQVSDSKDQA